jgi:hypothetical protein
LLLLILQTSLHLLSDGHLERLWGSTSMSALSSMDRILLSFLLPILGPRVERAASNRRALVVVLRRRRLSPAVGHRTLTCGLIPVRALARAEGARDHSLIRIRAGRERGRNRGPWRR